MCPEGNWIGNSTDSVIMEFVLPSNILSRIGEIDHMGILYLQMNEDSMKQCVELETTKDLKGTFGTSSEHKLTTREVGLERAEALILTSLLALTKSMQSLECIETEGLLTVFLSWRP